MQVIDRLGTVPFQRLARMCGGRVMSSVNASLEDRDLGLLDCVEDEQIMGKRYLRLDKA